MRLNERRIDFSFPKITVSKAIASKGRDRDKQNVKVGFIVPSDNKVSATILGTNDKTDKSVN